ncbi:hypothetical protein M569_14754, partial [Genlisea aurea]
GGLVWVRQKNGSWWPGKILNPEELPESRVAAPKSGTPLMLLGKKGTTVHWFNLEKSKRIKAFHCGEYEDCIEKAKSASNKGIRKGGRLEDAILKALELETALAHHRKVYAEDEEEEEQEEEDRANRATTSSSRGSEADRRVSEPPHEENGAGPKRSMRGGLENLGASIPSTLKRKRSSQAAAHELLKRRNRRRRRPLTKVLASGNGPAAPPPGRKNGTLKDAEETTSAKSSKARRKRFPGDEDGGSSQTLFDVPLVSEDKIPTGTFFVFCPDFFRHVIGKKVSNVSFSYVIFYAAVVCDASRRDRIEPLCVGGTECASEWLSKGKRNSRLRRVDAEEDESLPDGSKRLLPNRLSRYAVNPKYDPAEFPLRHHHHHRIPSPRLYDVAVEEKPSSRPHHHQQRNHVPYVSLASEANGAPIAGHPVTVEVLDRGSCDGLVAASKPAAGSRSRRKSGIQSKKTRKLSSFTAAGKQQATIENSKQQQQQKHQKQQQQPSSVTCVPIRIVFGRINAALSERL